MGLNIRRFCYHAGLNQVLSYGHEWIQRGTGGQDPTPQKIKRLKISLGILLWTKLVSDHLGLPAKCHLKCFMSCRGWPVLFIKVMTI